MSALAGAPPGNACSSTCTTSSSPPPPSPAVLLAGPFLTLFPLSPHCCAAFCPFLNAFPQRHHQHHQWAQPCPAAGPLEPAGTSQNHLEVSPSGTGPARPLTEPPTSPHGWGCARPGVCHSPQRRRGTGEGGLSLRRVSPFLLAQAPAASGTVPVLLPVPPGCAERAVVRRGWKTRNLPALWPRVSADADGFAAWGGVNGPDGETHQKFKFHLEPISCCCGIARGSRRASSSKNTAFPSPKSLVPTAVSP